MAPKLPNKCVIEVNEVDQALAGPSKVPTNSKASDPKGSVNGNFLILQDGTALDLTAHVAELVSKELAKRSASSLVGVGAQNKTFQCRCRQQGQVKRPHDQVSEDSDSEYDSEFNLDAGDVLGADVNTQVLARAGLGDDDLSDVQLGECDHNLPLPNPNLSDEPLVLGQDVPNPNPDLEVDPDLPVLQQSTQNFWPNAGVVNWVRGCLNDTLDNEQQKTLEKSFIHDPSLNDIFSPIKSNKHLTDAMKAKSTKDADGYNFDRYECEKRLYKGQSLFGLSLAPIMKALTKLTDVPGSKEAKNLIGEGLRGFSQGWHEVTYARRELYRNFVKRDIQPHLYANKPSHNQMFGGESIDHQVAKAITASNDKSKFIFKPTFRSAAYTSKFQNSSGFRGTGSNAKGASNSNRGQYKYGRGKGKGRGRGKGKSTNSAKTTKSDK